jgi:hypothetical protein
VLLAQVRSLYGPLLACVTASKSAFEAMVHQHSPQGSHQSFVELVRANPEGREGQIYRRAPLLHLRVPMRMKGSSLGPFLKHVYFSWDVVVVGFVCNRDN